MREAQELTKKEKAAAWIVAWMLAIAPPMIGFALLLDAAIPLRGDVPGGRGGFFWEYQGIVGGFLAVGGAVATVIYLRRQVIAAEKAANAAREEAREARKDAEETRKQAERSRRVDLASHNRPLITVLERMAGRGRGLNESIARMGPGAPLDHEAFQLIMEDLGAELGMIPALVAAHRAVEENVGIAVGSREYAGTQRWSEKAIKSFDNNRFEAERAVDAFSELSTRIARLLALGRSVLELATKSKVEIEETAVTPEDF